MKRRRRKKSRPRETKRRKKPEPVSVTIDFEKINQRILAMPVPARNYEEIFQARRGLYLSSKVA